MPGAASGPRSGSTIHPPLTTAQAWRSVAALNGVSALAQLSQYGLGSTLLPLALAARGAAAWQIGLASAALWLGMAAGLLVATGLTQRWGYRRTLVGGQLLAALAFALMPALPWAAWWLAATAVGAGMGLRWIANETWLYRLAPPQALGRVVGAHETLISAASVAGPLIVLALGTEGPAAFWVAAASSAAALLPMAGAQPLAAAAADTDAPPRRWSPAALRQSLSGLSLGAWVAGLGGWMEGGFIALLPVLAASHGWDGERAAWLMTLIGIGGMALQLGLGWLADHHGLRRATQACVSLALLATVAALAGGGHWPVMQGVALAMGGIGGGFLTLGMIHAAQGPDAASISQRVREVSLVYTALSAGGPLAGGWLVSATGQPSALLWWQLGLVSLTVHLATGRRR